MRDDSDEISVRVATGGDLEEIAHAWPAGPLPTALGPEQLALHLRTFPDGQLVAVDEGERIVGAATALALSLGRDPHREHSWAGATDDGWLRNHDAARDTLYVARLAVDPTGPRREAVAALLAGLERTCQRHNLRRIVLCARPAGCSAYPDLSVEEYARRVEAEELADPELTPLLARGLHLRRVIGRYRRDAECRDQAAFLEWLNDDYHPRARKDLSIRVSCVQYRMRRVTDFDGFAQQVRYFVDVPAGYGADFVVFPEFVTAQLMSCLGVNTAVEAVRRLTDYTEQVDELFQGLAREFQVGIVGGTHPQRFEQRIENVASLYLPDGTVYRQPKLHVTPNERRWWGIEGGNRLAAFDTPKARVGLLVCYDVEFPETARYLADQGAQVIFVPFCTDDRQAYLRVRYCAQARAVENQVYVALAGTVGNLPDVENMDIQYAQSAVLSPSDFAFARDGILVEAGVNTETVITTDLDFEALEEAIQIGSVRPRIDRRRDLFEFSATFEDVPTE